MLDFFYNHSIVNMVCKTSMIIYWLCPAEKRVKRLGDDICNEPKCLAYEMTDVKGNAILTFHVPSMEGIFIKGEHFCN